MADAGDATNCIEDEPIDAIDKILLMKLRRFTVFPLEFIVYFSTGLDCYVLAHHARIFVLEDLTVKDEWSAWTRGLIEGYQQLNEIID